MLYYKSHFIIIGALLFLLFIPQHPPCATHVFSLAAASMDRGPQDRLPTDLKIVFSGKEARWWWGDARHNALIFGAGMALASAILVVVFVVRSSRRREQAQTGSRNLFMEASTRCGLTDEESEKLMELLSYQNVMQPHTIFQSLPLFEQCLDAQVSRLLQSGGQVSADGPDVTLLSSIRKKLGFAHLPLEHPLVSTRNISIGQVGTIFGREGSRPLFNKVSVVDNNSLFFTVQYNVDKEDHSRLAPETQVRFVFARQGDGLYGVQVKVANAKEAGAIGLLHTMEMRRSQVRHDVRIETNLPMRFRLLSTKDQDKSEIQRGHLVTAKMSDISGGGLSFLHEQSLRPGDLISISFDLPGQSFVGITGKIVHLTLREGKSAQVIKHHIQFINIEQRKREAIIRYVFEKERQLSQSR